MMVTVKSSADSSCKKWTDFTENTEGSAPAYERYWFANLELAEIYDLQWAPDSTYIIAGATNARAQIVKVRTKETQTLVGHTSLVKGVAWDPLNKYVVTQSSDRSCKAHLVISLIVFHICDILTAQNYCQRRQNSLPRSCHCSYDA